MHRHLCQKVLKYAAILIMTQIDLDYIIKTVIKLQKYGTKLLVSGMELLQQ
jgi:hypothetical protein